MVIRNAGTWTTDQRGLPAGRIGDVYAQGLKRWFDLLLVLACAPIVLPVVLLLAGVTALDGGHPFYVQTRIGRHGRPFRMLKLRTMVVNADTALARHLAADPGAREEWRRTQKLRRDPRVTGFGRLMRRSSLDELPQLWNVLRGEMSLVGPRPFLPDQMTAYPGTAYFLMAPGITGSWQVSVRHESAFVDRAWYDTRYFETRSFPTDLAILFRTVGVTLRATGV